MRAAEVLAGECSEMNQEGNSIAGVRWIDMCIMHCIMSNEMCEMHTCRVWEHLMGKPDEMVRLILDTPSAIQAGDDARERCTDSYMGETWVAPEMPAEVTMAILRALPVAAIERLLADRLDGPIPWRADADRRLRSGPPPGF